MNFPGNNKLTLSSESLEALIAEKLSGQFGENIRITDLAMGSYGTELTVRFTSDPAKSIEPAPGAAE